MQQEVSNFNWETIAAGVMEGRRRAMEESLRWNLPMYGLEDGRILEISPGEIKQFLANFPTNFSQ